MINKIQKNLTKSPRRALFFAANAIVPRVAGSTTAVSLPSPCTDASSTCSITGTVVCTITFLGTVRAIVSLLTFCSTPHTYTNHTVHNDTLTEWDWVLESEMFQLRFNKPLQLCLQRHCPVFGSHPMALWGSQSHSKWQPRPKRPSSHFCSQNGPLNPGGQVHVPDQKNQNLASARPTEIIENTEEASLEHFPYHWLDCRHHHFHICKYPYNQVQMLCHYRVSHIEYLPTLHCKSTGHFQGCTLLHCSYNFEHNLLQRFQVGMSCYNLCRDSLLSNHVTMVS